MKIMQHCNKIALTLCLSSAFTAHVMAQSPPDLTNLDILVPDGDTLVRGVSATSAGDFHPGDKTFIGDGSCKYQLTIPWLTCKPNFCSVQTIAVAGVPIQASPDIDCSGVQSCSETHTQSVTVTSTTAITGSVSVANGDVISKAIKATASLGGGVTWSDSATTTTTFSFTPNPRDKGHIMFVPYMLEACGTYYTFFDDLICSVSEFVPMSCAQTPFKIGSGEAAGVSCSQQAKDTC